MPSINREESIFQAAIQLETGQARQSFLEAACSDDSGLRTRIDALIQAYESPDSDLQPVPPDTVLVPQVAEEVGTRIGPYTLREQLGEGGMGVVYVAEQKEPVRRLVALKIIKPGMDTRQVVSRFNAERQALAMMDHPNIAKVIDGGSTENGRPYFVMELIRGAPLTEYCDQLKMTVQERLELLATVCEAVQHAHLKGIIHRDLKPSNILVTEVDGKPVPKVIDFGVAKAISQQLTEQSIYTQFSQMIGTPLYMSPEQAGLSGVDIDTRSDVYSLGVVLYELLTGDTPFDRDDVRKSNYEEMRRMICEREPAKPSARVSTLKAEDGSTISERRRISPARLQQTIRGELDWIVMQALEKDRNRRYESASALAADIERYLNNEPVLACPPSTSYRLRKFADRNRGLLATASLLLITLLTATAVSISYAFQAEAAREQADEQKDAAIASQEEADEQKEAALAAQKRAEENFRKARETVDTYLTKVSEDTLLNQPNMQPLRKDLLELALKYYQGFVEQRPNDPDLQGDVAEAYLRLSRVQTSLGSRTLAMEYAKNAVEHQEQLVNMSSSDRVRIKKLAECYYNVGNLHFLMGESESGLPYAERAVSILEPIVEENGRDAELLYIYCRAIRCLTDCTPSVLKRSLESPGDLSRSDRKLEKQIAERLVAIEPESAEYRRNLAFTIKRLAGGTEDLDEKIVHLKQAIAIGRDLNERDPSDQRNLTHLGKNLSNIARHYSRQRKSEDALKHTLEALEIYSRLVEENPSVREYRLLLANSEYDVYSTYGILGRIAECRPHLNTAIEMMEKLEAETEGEKRFLEITYSNRAYYRGNYPTSETSLADAINDYTKCVTLNPKRSLYYLQRGNLRSRVGDLTGSASDYLQGLKLAPYDQGYLGQLDQMLSILVRMPKEQSLELLDEALANNQKEIIDLEQSERMVLASINCIAGTIFAEHGDVASAIDSCQAADRLLGSIDADEHWLPYLKGVCQFKLGSWSFEQKRNDEAVAFIQKALSNFEVLSPESKDAQALCHLILGRIQKIGRSQQDAHESFRKAKSLIIDWKLWESGDLYPQNRWYPILLLGRTGLPDFFYPCLLAEIHFELGELEKARLNFNEATQAMDYRVDEYIDQIAGATEVFGRDFVAQCESCSPQRLLGSLVVKQGGTVEFGSNRVSEIRDLNQDDVHITGIKMSDKPLTGLLAVMRLVEPPILEWLDLSDTTLGLKAVPILQSMPHLRRIDLSRAVVTEETLQALREKIPDAEIIWSKDTRSRAIVENVLEAGWKLWVHDSRSSRSISMREEIPSQPFLVHEIRFNPGYRHTDDDLTKLATLEPDAVHKLSLYGDVVTEIGLSFVSRFRRLRRLHVGELHISGSEILEKFPDLEFLALNQAEADDADLSEIGKLKRLNYLAIHETPKISDSGLRHLSALTWLDTLKITSGRLSGEGLVHLRDLPILDRLSLQRNDLRNENLAHVSEMTSLHELDLKSNPKLSDDCLKHLLSLRNLERLDLRETQVTTDGVALLQEKLPDCEILFTTPLPPEADVESDDETSLDRDDSTKQAVPPVREEADKQSS